MRLALAAALLLAAASAPAQLLDGVVARVDRSVITWSQVVQEAVFRRLGAADVADSRAVAESLVRRSLLVAEARKMKIEADPAQVAAEERAVVEAGGGAGPFWDRARRFGVTEADLERRSAEVVLVRRYEDLRRDMTYVPEAEVRSFYSGQADVLGARPLAEVRDEVRAFLAQRKHQQQLDEWITRQVAEGRARLIEPPDGWPALPRLP